MSNELARKLEEAEYLDSICSAPALPIGMSVIANDVRGTIKEIEIGAHVLRYYIETDGGIVCGANPLFVVPSNTIEIANAALILLEQCGGSVELAKFVVAETQNYNEQDV